MSHLTDRTLQTLVDGTATQADVERIRRHVEDCRACAQRLEEWRDNVAEVDQRFPELALEHAPSARVSTDGLIFLPTKEKRRVLEMDLTTALWVGVILMGVLAVYGALKPKEARVPDNVSVLNGGYQPGSRPFTPAESSAGRRDSVTPAPAPTRPSTARPAPAPPASPRNLPSTGGNAGAMPLPVSPGFRAISLAEATRRLGGPLRTIAGLTVDHYEVGPASAVAGAQSKLDVIRTVYRAPDGDRILLDQQLIPADSSGFRPIEDPSLESGETQYRSADNGVSIATWLGDAGYWHSLVVRASVDSLKQLVQLVK
ncbi:MAG TPA: hypothetical protein VMG41_03050 [Gemmatimonadales bacterium]|nr:hypothetical protein [Gemmatimonadales bacterium]